MTRHVATVMEVQAFLTRFIEAMDIHGLDMWTTAKNNAFMAESGFLKDDAELLVRALRPVDYSKGPEEDDDPRRPPGEVWIFCREFEGYEMYVKLKLEKHPYYSSVPSICLSFHEQEHPLERPHWPRR